MKPQMVADVTVPAVMLCSGVLVLQQVMCAANDLTKCIASVVSAALIPSHKLRCSGQLCCFFQVHSCIN
jgi:hypothetical protein